MQNKSGFKSLILILFGLTIISIYGCGDDNISVTNPPGSTSFISGTISNYPGGSTIVKAKLTAGTPSDSFFAGIDTVDNNGMLNMNLATPPFNFLVSFNSGTIPPGVVISDTTTRAAQFGSLRVYGFSNELLGELQRKNFTDSQTVGSFVVQYLYSTKPFTITGSDTTVNLTDTTLYTYNLTFAEGWNAFTLRVAEKRANYTKYEFVSGDAAGAAWYYAPVIIDIRRNKNFLIN